MIQTSGLFTTDDETYLAFKTGGIIEKIYVKEGDAIRKGQLLATLNLTEIEAQVAQARLSFEKAKRDFRASKIYIKTVLPRSNNFRMHAPVWRWHHDNWMPPTLIAPIPKSGP